MSGAAQPLAPEKDARIRELLAQGTSVAETARIVGVAKDTVRLRRPSGPQQARRQTGAARAGPAGAGTGEVDTRTTGGADDAAKIATDAHGTTPQRELDLPDDEDETEGIDPSVIPLSLQIPHSLVTTWELLAADGLALNFNEWLVEMVDVCLAEHWGTRLALVHVGPAPRATEEAHA